jgi:hypothetical protein
VVTAARPADLSGRCESGVAAFWVTRAVKSR